MKPVKALQYDNFTDRSKAVLLLWIICVLCLVFLMLSRLFIAVLWSPAGKGLTSWLLLVMFMYFCSFPCDILGQVWYLFVSFPDLCCLSYFTMFCLNVGWKS